MLTRNGKTVNFVIWYPMMKVWMDTFDDKGCKVWYTDCTSQCEGLYSHSEALDVANAIASRCGNNVALKTFVIQEVLQ